MKLDILTNILIAVFKLFSLFDTLWSGVEDRRNFFDVIDAFLKYILNY